MLHIGCIDNIAAAGYQLVTPDWPVVWHYGPPSAVYQAVRLGACDAALLPVGGYSELAHVMEPIGEYGIGCRGAVQSVQVFGRAPIRSLVMSGQPIYATPETKTSRKLFATLCQMEYGRVPALTSDAPQGEGMLLIGGEALRHARLNPGWPEQRDLGRWWYEQTQLPFVFARWVVNRGLSDAQRESVRAWLAACVARCASESGAAALRARMERDGFPAELADAYYRRIQYPLSSAHLEGERVFLSLQREGAPWLASA